MDSSKNFMNVSRQKLVFIFYVKSRYHSNLNLCVSGDFLEVILKWPRGTPFGHEREIP